MAKKLLFLSLVGACLLTVSCTNPKETIQLNAPTGVAITVEPNVFLADELATIKLSGLKPGQGVTISVTTEDDFKRAWQSKAAFKADQDGNIDTSQDAATHGTFKGLDPTGLFWSMKLVSGNAKRSSFEKESLTPGQLSIIVESDKKVIAKATATKLFVSPDVVMEEFNGVPFKAKFFKPARPGPWPAVIVVGGSGGGFRWSENMAALLASRGFASLAVAYFGIEGLPNELAQIPLEYFGNAIAWLKNKENVDALRIGVMGISKGGELALVLGTKFADLKSVVAYVPSSVVFQGVYKDFRKKDVSSSWTYAGQPLPFVRLKPPALAIIKAIFAKMFDLSIETLPVFKSSLEDNGAVEKAVIPVEQTSGAILLISGKKDGAWPSYEMSQMVVQRLQDKNFSRPFEHLAYEDAGHLIGYPNIPTTISVGKNEGSGLNLEFGGDSKSTAHASIDSWKRVLGFLEKNLTYVGH